jgi:hypothetical protein
MVRGHGGRPIGIRSAAAPERGDCAGDEKDAVDERQESDESEGGEGFEKHPSEGMV